MVGARLQGSRCIAGGHASECAAAVWDDLYEIEARPPDGEWTAYTLLSDPDVSYSAVRLLGPSCGEKGETDGVPCRCDLAEIEWHLGEVTQQLSSIELGRRSFVVDNARVKLHAEGATVIHKP